MSRRIVPGSYHRDRGWIAWLAVGFLSALASVVTVARSRRGASEVSGTRGGRSSRVSREPAPGVDRSRRRRDVEAASGREGGTVGGEGTPVPVDVGRDRRWRPVYLLFLIGPVIWITHFGVVYLVAEAGCTGGGPGLELLAPPVPANVTIVATIVAALACLAAAEWGRRWWRRSQDGQWAERPSSGADPATVESAGMLALTSAGMSLLSFLAVLFVGVSGVVFPGC